jgi:hypothetical protein
MVNKPLTSAQKQKRYRAKIRAAALRDGFVDKPKSKAEAQALTAWANGEYKMVKV